VSVDDFPILSYNNHLAIGKAKRCGCYFCLLTFPSTAVVEFTDDRRTALCPNCGIDTLLPDVTDTELLAQGLERWFTGQSDSQ
jgi:hypothetical protein